MESTSRRVRRAIVQVLAAAAVAAVVAGPVAAAGPQPLTIVAHLSKQGFGTFVASGAAVDGGLVCAGGTVLDTGNVVGGYQSGQKVQVQSRKALTCADGSGTIDVKIQIHAVFGGEEPFGWVIQGGTDAYAGLQGSGSGTTSENTAESNVNTYDGFVVAR